MLFALLGCLQRVVEFENLGNCPAKHQTVADPVCMSVLSAVHTCLQSMAGSLGFIAVSIKQGAALHACLNFANV